ncbi:uncharacterized protein LOC132195732 [Neocloeon triangulifer]|uniref:uncharacterized protein LOC132195732 n=1 Tax=Neocloeon triangulifer TaxID=2078957 RepID=UPI00286EBDE4|nr:uncharacterized protein LOC132195732 [Neocloeon triangulifer]
MVMVRGDDDGDIYYSPGVFVSKRIVVTNREISYGTATVAVGGQIIPAVWISGNGKVAVLKICYKFPGPFETLMSNHFDFTTNVTGTVAFYYPNGTLFGHTATVLANANCPQEYTDTGLDSSFFDTDGSSACTQLDAAGDCSYANLPEYIDTALVINGVVEGFVSDVRCHPTTGLYEQPSGFKLIPFNKDYILTFAPDAIP